MKEKKGNEVLEIRIGIRQSTRELSFESNLSASAAKDAISAALASGAKSIELSDDKGRIFVIPTDTLAYVEIGAEETRRVGFIA